MRCLLSLPGRSPRSRFCPGCIGGKRPEYKGEEGDEACHSSEISRRQFSEDRERGEGRKLMEHFFPLPNSLFCPRTTSPTLTLLLLLCTLPSVHCPVRRATGGGRRRRRPHSNYFFSRPILAPPSPRGDITREKRKKERGRVDGIFPV